MTIADVSEESDRTLVVPDPRHPIAGHERFLQQMERELSRARTLGHQIAMLMVRPAKQTGDLVGHTCPTLRELLRPTDTIALYAADIAEALVVETDHDEMSSVGQRIVESSPHGGPPLLCGVALYPDAATSTEELLERSRAAMFEATAQEPLRFAAYTAATPAETLGSTVPELDTGPAPIARNDRMNAIFETARHVGQSTEPVLIRGEAGVGKGVVARRIHTAGPRGHRELIAVSCGALPPQPLESLLFGCERGAFPGTDRRTGRSEAAEGSTLLLDGVADVPLRIQTALLRLLETGSITRLGSTRELPVDVRIVATTQADLERLCNEGRFRRDLLERLRVISLDVPPLRERPEEIEPLAESFLQCSRVAEECAVRGLTREALKCLYDYDWPGNVRELRNIVEHGAIKAQQRWITPAHLSERVRRIARARAPATASEARPHRQRSLKEQVREFEKQTILEVLDACHGNRSETARRLKVPLRTLTYKMRALGVTRDRTKT